MAPIKRPTPGPWIVTTSNLSKLSHASISVKAVKSNFIVAVTGAEGSSDEATVIANAALIAIAPEMLDALIAIHEFVSPAYEGEVDLIAMHTLISDIFEKLANEAGEL
jgi:hypothetical protein